MRRVTILLCGAMLAACSSGGGGGGTPSDTASPETVSGADVATASDEGPAPDIGPTPAYCTDYCENLLGCGYEATMAECEWWCTCQAGHLAPSHAATFFYCLANLSCDADDDVCGDQLAAIVPDSPARQQCATKCHSTSCEIDGSICLACRTGSDSYVGELNACLDSDPCPYSCLSDLYACE